MADEPIELPIHGGWICHVESCEIKDWCQIYLRHARSAAFAGADHSWERHRQPAHVHAILKKHPAVISFTLDHPQFAAGATLVQLKEA